MGTVATMGIAIVGDAQGLKKALGDAQGQLRDAAASMREVGKSMTAGITLPLVGMGVAALKFSSDFNASMANIASLGVSTERVVEFKDAIQNMAIETGKSTSDIADGMYQVVSAFGDTADTVDILRTNVKLAKSGLSTTAEAIALTSSVTKGYNDTSAEAVMHTADLAIQTVALGQTTLPELAGAIGAVTPLAGSMGVKMEDLFAVMATGSGVTGSSSQVATQFRGILQSLMAPTASMTKLTKDMGFSNAQAMLQSKGLQATIKAIVDAAARSGTPLQSFIGSIEGQTLALSLAGPQADAFAKNMQAMQDVAGKADAAFLAQTQGINKVGFSMEQTQRYGEVLMQKLGDGLAPMLGTLLDKAVPLADTLVKLADQFVKMDSATQGWVIGGFALLAALGPLLMILPGIATAVGGISGALAVLAGPVGLVIAAVALLGLAWATNFGGIQEKTAAAWAAMQPALEAMKTKLGEVAGEVQKWLAWAVPEGAKLWNLTVAATADFTQATADWLAWAGPEAQKAITLAINLPTNITASATAWMASWKAGAEASLKTWQPNIELMATWAPGAFDAMKITLLATFAPILLLAEWQSETLNKLWNSLSNQLKEPVMIFGSWVSTALSDLWDAAQAWFNDRPITANVGFSAGTSTIPAGQAGAGTTLPVDVNPVPPSGMMKALGGRVASGESYIVGERGAELFVPEVNGRIVPNGQLGGALGGAVNFNVTLQSPLEVEAFARKVAQYLQRRN